MLSDCTLQPRLPSPFSGTCVRKIAFALSDTNGNLGIAVSVDGSRLALSHGNCTISVYGLPTGTFLSTLGSPGDREGEFSHLGKLCFAANGNILATEGANMRVQEVTLTGAHVRAYSLKATGGPGGSAACGVPSTVAANEAVVVVGTRATVGSTASNAPTSNRIVVFGAGSGQRLFSFGSPVVMFQELNGLRITPDGTHVLAAEATSRVPGQRAAGRISMFALATGAAAAMACDGLDGVFLPANQLKCASDIEFTETGAVVVSDMSIADRVHRLCVFSGDRHALKLSAQFGGKDGGKGQYISYPRALAAYSSQVFALCADGVFVFK